MLVVTRKANETIIVNESIKITVLRCGSGAVRIGIDAPPSTAIRRGELPVITAAQLQDKLLRRLAAKPQLLDEIVDRLQDDDVA
mgnify:CR=1 FL=1